MRLLTPDHEYRPVQEREWPLAGLQTERRASLPTSISLVPGPGGDPKRASYADLYRENPWVYACVNKLARGVERLPFTVLEALEEGGQREVRPNRFEQGRRNAAQRLAKILDQPAPTISASELRYSTSVDLLIYGNALLYFDRRDNELWRIPWADTQVVLGDDERIAAFEVSPQSSLGERTFLPQDVVHLGRGSDPEDVLGMSPLKPLADTSGLLDAIHRYLTSYFEHQAAPSGHIKLPPGSDKDVLDFMRGEVEQLYSSPENAGRPMVTTGDWQSIHDEPRHSSSLALEELSREEVCGVIGVPVDLLTAGSPEANVTEFRRMFYHDVVGPLASRIEDDLNAQLVTKRSSWRNLEVKFDLDEILRPNMRERGEGYRLMRFVYTLNEFREREGLPPLDDPRAEVVWMPSNEVPLNEETLGQMGDGNEEPNEFGDGVPAEEQRATVGMDDAHARLERRLTRHGREHGGCHLCD